MFDGVVAVAPAICVSAGATVAAACTVPRLNRTHADAAHFARTCLVPGLTHGSGGPATDDFDGLSAFVRRVEAGQTPDRIEARGGSTLPGVSRPLSKYPQIARYVGGREKSAARFVCRP